MNLNATILGQAISFFIFVWFCMKYIWPPIIMTIETRQKNIEKSLNEAKQAKKELHQIRQDMKQEIHTAKQKALMIIKQANHQKTSILEAAKKTALNESKKIFIKNKSEIDMEIMLARKNLRKEIIDVSFLIAEKIIQKNIPKENCQNEINALTTFLYQVKK